LRIPFNLFDTVLKPDFDQPKQEDSILLTVKIEGQGNVTPTSGTYEFNPYPALTFKKFNPGLYNPSQSFVGINDTFADG